jgi:hypothetical protein
MPVVALLLITWVIGWLQKCCIYNYFDI